MAVGFVFDIVNGFFERCRGNGIGDHSFNTSREQGRCAWKQKKSFDSRNASMTHTVLSLVVRVFKREVRAFGGCLGMHRR